MWNWNTTKYNVTQNPSVIVLWSHNIRCHTADEVEIKLITVVSKKIINESLGNIMLSDVLNIPGV